MTTRVVSTTLSDPSGPFRVAASEQGVVAASWEPDEDAFRLSLEARLGIQVVSIEEVAPAHTARRLLASILPALEGLLRGERIDPSTIPVDLHDRPAFDRTVLAAVRDVGWGRTASYGAIARRIGAPRAARAVGGALGRNPISMVIPCHRIIAADGTLGGYGGVGWIDRDRELSRKEALLMREGITVARRAG